MMFKWINKQPEIDAVKIKKSMTEYHHLINNQAYFFILKEQSMGENEYGRSGHLYISHFWSP